MYRLLIFGGTTEGRELAVFCAERGISADVSSATEYGASLLPDGVGRLTGRLDADGITGLLQSGGYSAVIDATHPYAEQATADIRAACERTSTVYHRLLRESCDICGERADSMDELIDRLNSCGGTVLSVMGSKSMAALAKVKNHRERLWLRLLPAEGIEDRCAELGFDTGKLILEKGPFSAERNIAHIRQCGADIMVTKNSGQTGGYPEKVRAAADTGIRLITLAPPVESGMDLAAMKSVIARESESV